MWVRVTGWMIADGELAMPTVGSVLAGVGIRACGDVSAARPGWPEGIVAVRGGAPHEVLYRLTGRAREPRDFDADEGSGGRHAGAEFLLTVGEYRFQVQWEGWADEVPTGACVTVIGRLCLVGGYEWDAFGLTESRADWQVDAVARSDDGDTMLDLVAPNTR